MEKTGIVSIDKFFNYGQPDNYQPYPFKPMIEEVLEMFRSEYTQTLYDRKANAIIKYCNERPYGFFYQQVEGLTLLFQYAKIDLFQKQINEMVPALQRILQVVSQDKNSMFNRNAGSDELRYLRLVPAYLNSLQPFLQYEKHTKANPALEGLRHSAIIYLKIFAQKQLSEIYQQSQLQSTSQPGNYSQLTPNQALLTQGTKHLRAIAQSNIINPIVQLLFNYQTQLPILLPLLQLFSAMVQYNRLAYQLCQRGVIHLIYEAMMLFDDFRNPIMNVGLQIFWSAIEGVGVQCMTGLLNEEYIFLLKDVFVKVIKQGYKLDDKCLRNQLLILINYLIGLDDAVPLFLARKQMIKSSQTHKNSECFLEVLFEYAITDQAKFYDNKPKLGDRKTVFGTSSEDLEFKKLIWSGLLMAVQSGNQEAIGIAQNCDFIKYLLLYVDSTNTSYAISRWSGPQLRQLQQHSLSILADIILHMKDDFQAKRGIFCLTKFLSNIADVERRERCLRAFANASLFDESYKLKISEQGLFDYLLEFLQTPQSPMDIKQLCFTILANLCKNCKKNRKMFRQKNGIDLIVSSLRDQKIAISDRYALLGLALLNCLWNAVLGSRRSQQIFINSQGVFDLLEFVQICTYSHRKLALSCLSCLVENQKAISQFLDWNGESTMVNATQLLIRLYSEQDQRFGVKYKQGIVLDKQKPLVPLGWKKDAGVISQLKDFTTSGTQTFLVNRIKQFVGNCDLRIAIFSILYRVGFNKNELNAQQQQVMEVIQLYPHFKMGQIWKDIGMSLSEDGIEPTEDDEHWLRTSIQEFEQQMNNCVNTQSLIKKQFNLNEQRQLQRFFQVIKYNKQIK